MLQNVGKTKTNKKLCHTHTQHEGPFKLLSTKMISKMQMDQLHKMTNKLQEKKNYLQQEQQVFSSK